MSFRRMLFACAGALALGSCVTAQAPLTAEALLQEPYTLRSAKEFDAAAFFAAAPDWMQASFSEASFDSATGAMVIGDLAISFPALPGVRLHAQRAQIWSGDVGALETLKAGGAAAGAVQIFERAVFEGVSGEGFHSADGAATASLAIDKLAYDGLAARNIPFTVKQGAPELAAFVQRLAAFSLAVKFDGSAYSNFSMRLNENQGSEVLVGVAQAFMRGYDGGRAEYERFDGYSMTSHAPGPGGVLNEIAQRLDAPGRPRPEDKILQPHVRDMIELARNNPIAFIAARAGQLTTVQEIDSVEWRNIDIAGALRWLAKWELPPIAETELIDLGAMTVIGSRESWDGELVSAVDRSEALAYDFYWLVPSHVEVRTSGATLDVLKMLDTGAAMNGVGAAPETGSLEIQKIRAAIVAMGLETVRYDGALDWRWDGETGFIDFDETVDVADFAGNTIGLGLDGPSLAEWDALIRAANAAGKPQVDLREFVLNRFQYSVADRQLLDRLFAYLAGQAGASPEELRAGITATVRQAGVQLAAMNPRIPGYIDAIASFIEAGGTIGLNVAPPAPVDFETIAVTSQTAPQTLPDVLNLEITHTPAE